MAKKMKHYNLNWFERIAIRRAEDRRTAEQDGPAAKKSRTTTFEPHVESEVDEIDGIAEVDEIDGIVEVDEIDGIVFNGTSTAYEWKTSATFGSKLRGVWVADDGTEIDDVIDAGQVLTMEADPSDDEYEIDTGAVFYDPFSKKGPNYKVYVTWTPTNRARGDDEAVKTTIEDAIKYMSRDDLDAHIAADET